MAEPLPEITFPSVDAVISAVEAGSPATGSSVAVLFIFFAFSKYRNNIFQFLPKSHCNFGKNIFLPLTTGLLLLFIGLLMAYDVAPIVVEFPIDYFHEPFWSAHFVRDATLVKAHVAHIGVPKISVSVMPIKSFVMFLDPAKGPLGVDLANVADFLGGRRILPQNRLIFRTGTFLVNSFTLCGPGLWPDLIFRPILIVDVAPMYFSGGQTLDVSFSAKQSLRGA